MDITTFFILSFFIVIVPVCFIWVGIRSDRKTRNEPLSEKEKNHYFIRLVIDISNELKKLDKENDAKIFLEKAPEEKESFDKITSYSNYSTTSTALAPLGVVGALLGSSSANATNLLSSINTIRGIWKDYLLSKVIKDDTPKEERKKLGKEIEKKVNYLLNYRVLLATNQSDIKDAWKIILHDKTLKVDSLVGTAHLMIHQIFIGSDGKVLKIFTLWGWQK